MFPVPQIANPGGNKVDPVTLGTAKSPPHHERCARMTPLLNYKQDGLKGLAESGVDPKNPGQISASPGRS